MFRQPASLVGVLWLVRRDSPVPYHTGGIPQQSAHRTPTVFADRLDQRLLRLAPLRLSTLDELAAFVRDRNDTDTCGCNVTQFIMTLSSPAARDS